MLAWAALLCQTSMVCAQTKGAPWWNKAWKCRRKVSVYGSTGKAGQDVCYVEFATLNRARKDGGDIRVVSKAGSPLTNKIIFMGPGDICKLAIRLPGGRRGYETFYVYYDNPKVSPPRQTWEPKCGLLLETRTYKGGSYNSWSQMQSVLKRSENYVQGRGYVKNIFMGYNPFGPTQNYVALYRGWLLCPRSGTYKLATTSDEASFLFIDKRLIVQKPGRHRAARNARYQASVRLSAGLRAIAYYHVQTSGYDAAVAAWQPPGARTFVVIPPEAFPAPLKGTVSGYEIQGSPVAPDFRVRNMDEAPLGDRLIVRMGFTDTTNYPVRRQGTTTWDFGDGTTATGRSADHVYFAQGTYDVKLVVEFQGKQYSVTRAIRATEPYERQGDKPSNEKIKNYLPKVEKYPLEKMTSPNLVVAFDFFVRLRKFDHAVRAGETLVHRRKDVPERELKDKSIALASVLAEQKRDANRAVKALRAAEARLKNTNLKCEVAIEIARAMLKGGQADTAITELRRVLKVYASADKMLRRRAQIVVGDAYRQKAKYEDALAAYDKAALTPATKKTWDFKRRAVRIGILARSAEHYIRTKELDAAEDQLDMWEWEYPSEKLAGHSSLLRARVEAKRKNYAKAIRELEELAEVNPKSSYVPEGMMDLADYYRAIRDMAKAINVLETLVADYRDSPLVPKAEDKLKQFQRGQRTPPKRKRGR